MPKAKKLPSGSWRARVYSFTDENGRKHYRSFTAATKTEAEMLASKFANTKTGRKLYDMTVGEAIDRYIEVKTAVLSPSTIKGYRALQRNYFQTISKKKISKLTNADMQAFISSLSLELSPKTVKNISGLILPAIEMFFPDLHFKVTMPAKIPKYNTAPSDDEVLILLANADLWLKKCIALGACAGLRRGEICALKYRDIIGTKLFIHADMVLDEHNNWIYKENPKTNVSAALIDVSEDLIELLGSGAPDDFIIDRNPNLITKHFIILKRRFGLDHIRFHDLRHYYASTGGMLGIPDIIISDAGRWAHNSPVMKNVYQGNIKPISERYMRKFNDHFSELLKKSMP